MVEGFPSTSRFDARRRLGSGAFGVVYEAFDRDRQLLVALKTLRSAQSDALYLFKREFRSLADLNHPNLVALYELLTEGREWFFTMELLHGRSFIDHAWDIPSRSPEATTDTPTRPTLTTRLSIVPSGPREEHALQPRADMPIRGALDHERVREAFLQLAAGLNALHEAGKLHRDIKPRNVMVTFEGRVVLLDFGLVADVATGTANPVSRRVAGTPAYMAPEQAAAGAAQTASDWYSVGAMLYEILTGHLPFHGSTWDILADKQRLDPPPLDASASGVPDDLSSLCRELLARDPALRPTGRDVMARLNGSAAMPRSARRVAPARTFVGREAELRALDEGYAGITAGRATVIYIDGLSGMGKTTLVQHFLLELGSRAPETLVLTGRCYQQESVPYKGFDLLVDALSQWLSDTDAETVGALLPRDVRALVQLFPVLSRVDAIAAARRRSLDLPDAQEQRRRASAALRELLVGIAQQRPLVLFVDDLQWSDLDRAYLFGELLRPPNPPPLLFVGAYRSDEAETSPALRALLALHRTGQVSVDTREIALRELGPAEVEQVVAAVVGADRLPGLTGLVQRESGGNPFFVVELARLAASQRRDADARDINLESAIFARISTLGAPARRLLDVLALAARPLVPRVALQAARMEPADFGVLTSLRVAQLVRARETDRKEAVELYHDRIREVIGRAIAPAQAVEIHEHLAAVLEASGDADPEMLVHHFSQAGRFDRAAEHAVVAAERAAAALAFDRAARLYELAIRLRPDSTELPALRMKRADALANAGRGGDAGRAFLAAAEGVDQDRFIELQRRAAEQFLITGHLGEGLTALNSVLRAVGMRLAPTQHAAMIQLLIRRAIIRLRGLNYRERVPSTLPPRELLRIDSCWSVAVGLAFVDSMRAADFQARHCLLALNSGEPLRIARALALEVGYSSLGGTRTERRTQSVARAAVSLSQRLGTPHAIGLASLTTGIAAHMEGRWRASLDLCERADLVFRESCTGVTWELDTARLHIVSNTFFLGDLKRLRNLAPAMIKNADDRGDLYGSTALILRTAFIDALMHDEPEQAAERVNQAESPWSELGFLMQHYWGLMARLDILAYKGQGADALALIRDRWKPMADSQLLRVQFSFIEAFYRRARSALMAAREQAAGSSRRSELLEQVRRDTQRLTREPVDWGSGLGDLIDAGALMTRGDNERAMVSVSRAEEKLARAGMALHLALTRRAKGRLLGGDHGHALITASDEWLRASGITDPPAFQRMIAGWD